MKLTWTLILALVLCAWAPATIAAPEKETTAYWWQEVATEMLEQVHQIVGQMLDVEIPAWAASSTAPQDEGNMEELDDAAADSPIMGSPEPIGQEQIMGSPQPIG